MVKGIVRTGRKVPFSPEWKLRSFYHKTYFSWLLRYGKDVVPEVPMDVSSNGLRSEEAQR